MLWLFLDEELFRGGKDDTLHLETAPEKMTFDFEDFWKREHLLENAL